MGLRFRFRANGRTYKDVGSGIRKSLNDYTIKLRVYGWEGCKKAATILLAWSKELVPVDTETLKLEGKVTKVESSSSARATYQVSYYATPKMRSQKSGRNLGQDDKFNYAWIVHEDLTMRHPNGGQAKYLEQPYREHKAELLKIVADSMKRRK